MGEFSTQRFYFPSEFEKSRHFAASREHPAYMGLQPYVDWMKWDFTCFLHTGQVLSNGLSHQHSLLLTESVRTAPLGLSLHSSNITILIAAEPYAVEVPKFIPEIHFWKT